MGVLEKLVDSLCKPSCTCSGAPTLQAEFLGRPMFQQAHAVNVVKRCTCCDTLSDLLYLTDLRFLYNFFSTSPSSKNQLKDSAAIVKALLYSIIYLEFKVTLK